MIHSYFLYKYY